MSKPLKKLTLIFAIPWLSMVLLVNFSMASQSQLSKPFHNDHRLYTISDIEYIHHNKDFFKSLSNILQYIDFAQSIQKYDEKTSTKILLISDGRRSHESATAHSQSRTEDVNTTRIKEESVAQNKSKISIDKLQENILRQKIKLEIKIATFKVKQLESKLKKQQLAYVNQETKEKRENLLKARNQLKQAKQTASLKQQDIKKLIKEILAKSKQEKADKKLLIKHTKLIGSLSKDFKVILESLDLFRGLQATQDSENKTTKYDSPTTVDKKAARLVLEMLNFNENLESNKSFMSNWTLFKSLSSRDNHLKQLDQVLNDLLKETSSKKERKHLKQEIQINNKDMQDSQTKINELAEKIASYGRGVELYADFSSELKSYEIKSLKIYRSLLIDILNNELIERKHLQKFRKVLSALGLQNQTHPDEYIKVFLTSIKDEMLMGAQQKKVRLDVVIKKLESGAFDKKNHLRLKDFKIVFDTQHLENLRDHSRFMRTLSSFPAQFILFQMAVGAQIYRSHITDPLLYEAHTNPEALTQFVEQSLHHSSVVHLLTFFYFTGKANYYTYKMGNYFDQGFLRKMAPTVGLASGFYFSTKITDLLYDPNFLLCAKFFSSEAEQQRAKQLHVTPCEEAYQTWLGSGKWRHFIIDVSGLLAASALAHKTIDLAKVAIRLNPGSAALLGKVGGLFARGHLIGSMLINVYLFLEYTAVWENHIAPPLKKWATVNEIANENESLSCLLRQQNENQDDKNNRIHCSNTNKPIHAEYRMGVSDNSYVMPYDSMENKNNIIEGVKRMGLKFDSWSHAVSLKFQEAFFGWSRKVNKITLLYKRSEELLQMLFQSSQTKNYDFIPTSKQHGRVQTDKGFLIDKDRYEASINDSNIQSFIPVYIVCAAHYNKKEYSTIRSYFCLPKEETIDRDWTSQKFLIEMASLMLFERGYSDSDHMPINDIDKYLNKDSESMLFSSDLKYQVGDHDYRVVDQGLSKKKGLIRGFLNLYIESQAKNHKALAAAFYLLLDLPKNQATAYEIQNKYPIAYGFLNYIEVYQKGEIGFDPYGAGADFLSQEIKAQIKNNKEIKYLKQYSYNFFKQLICGSQSSGQEYFNAPKMKEFDGFTSFCNRYGKVDWDRQTLFSRPVRVNGKPYHNLWSALEIKVLENKNFASSQDLLKNFDQASITEIDRLADQNFNDIDNITKNYLLPGMVNSDKKILNITTCKQILNHYGGASSEIIKSFKSLEVSLFQIIYWLKKLESVSDLDPKDSCSALELLKKYHDRYAQTHKTYIRAASKAELAKAHIIMEVFKETQICMANNKKDCEEIVTENTCSVANFEACVPGHKIKEVTNQCLEARCHDFNKQQGDIAYYLEGVKSQLSIPENQDFISATEPCLLEGIKTGSTDSCMNPQNKIPIIMPVEVFLFEFLKKTHRQYLAAISLMNSGKKPDPENSRYDYLQYSMIFELRKNVSQFFENLNILRLKQDMENKLNAN